MGLFRDDGLSIIEGNGHMIDKKRKDTIRIFKNENLKITWEVNITKVCFLDVLFDLQTETYKPYHKANNKLVYVHTGSNHPKLILNNIPLGINRRLSSISSSETCFNDEKNEFQKALKEAGHGHILDFKKGIEKSRKPQFPPRSHNKKYISSDSHNSKQKDAKGR